MSSTTLVLGLLLALLLPVAILVGRHNIKVYRQNILRSLQDTYTTATGHGDLHLVSAFEIARYKYDLIEDGQTESTWKKDFLMYLLPCSAFIILSILGLYAT